MPHNPKLRDPADDGIETNILSLDFMWKRAVSQVSAENFKILQAEIDFALRVNLI